MSYLPVVSYLVVYLSFNKADIIPRAAGSELILLCGEGVWSFFLLRITAHLGLGLILYLDSIIV